MTNKSKIVDAVFLKQVGRDMKQQIACKHLTMSNKEVNNGQDFYLIGCFKNTLVLA